MVRDRLSIVLILVAILADVFLWHRIATGEIVPALYALDVGQGDSILAVFPNGMTVLTDAGPNASVVRELERVLPPGDRTIDLAIVTHPQLDHFGGFAEVISRFSVGALVVNGRVADDESAGSAWDELLTVARERNIPLIRLGTGDTVHQGEYGIDVLGPDDAWLHSGELNDTGIVELLHFPGWRALLTADIGFSAEDDLRTRFDIRADVLKISHHGSKHSTNAAFLDAVAPRAALISAGARNRYGHPTREVLERLRDAGVQTFRTDTHGTTQVRMEDGKLFITTER